MTSGDDTLNTPMPPTAVDDVRVAHTGWWNALLAADAVVLDTLLADDLTFHGPYGTAGTKAGFLANLRSGRLKYDSIKDEAPLIRLYGQTAIVTGRADIQFQREGQPMMERLYYTGVYGRTATPWQMHAWQSTIRADSEH